MDWKQFDQQRWQFLRYGRRELRRALTKQSASVLGALKDKGVSETLESVEFLVSEEPMREAFTKVYRRVGGYFGQITFRRYAKADNDVWVREILNWLETEGGDKITKITATTKKEIRKILSDGITQGMNIDDLSQLIKVKVGGVNRATLIARTEIISASNLGSMKGAKSTGLPMKKLWLSTPDERTRGRDPFDEFDHTSVKPVDSIDDLFSVSGESLMYPGDSAHGASPGNTIQCRCALGYEPY